MGTLNNTVVLPVQIVGFVQKTPLFWVREVFVDVGVLQQYLELHSTEYTSLLVKPDSRGQAAGLPRGSRVRLPRGGFHAHRKEVYGNRHRGSSYRYCLTSTRNSL